MRCCRLRVLSVLAILLLTLQQQACASDMPPSSNPHAGESYGGCRGGYCASPDEALELQFWQAAGSGDAKTVSKLLEGGQLNLTRNIVPDDDGLARVVDVAVWVASERGHHDVMQTLLEFLFRDKKKLSALARLYRYEDGHILDMAASNGDVKMVKLLLDFDMTVGPSALAHAAHFNHTEVMEVLMSKPTDLKSAMQAISNGGSAEMARLLLKATREKQIKDKEEERQGHGAYDWHGDYVSIAVKSGNVAVLNVLLEGGYELKWQQAQDLIKAAAEQGSAEVMDILLSQPLFKKDEDELDEAVDTALKASAELGKPGIVSLILKQYPAQSKNHCKAALFRALKYGRDDVAKLLNALCPVDISKSEKLQGAEWVGKVLKAARTGDAAAMKELLSHKQAKQRLGKLRKALPEEDVGDTPKEKAPEGPAIEPKNDPLVIAAVAGHLDVVKQLEELHMLCSPCAASEASKTNQTAVIQHLAKGTGKVVLQNYQDVIQDALRIIAYSMEAHNWELVRWFLGEHGSPDLGAYFLPIIAQEGKLGDMQNMLQILSDLARTDTYYFKQQVHSALISAALGGHLDVLLLLKQHSEPELYVEQPAGAEEEDYEPVDPAAVADKTEL